MGAPLVGVRVRPEVRAWIVAEAQRRGVTYSQIIRELLDNALKLYPSAIENRKQEGGEREKPRSALS
jgi:transposase-like protein